MAIQKNENLKIHRNEEFIQKAQDLKPVLNVDRKRPGQIVEVLKDESVIHGWKMEDVEAAEELKKHEYKKGDSFIVDFEDHQVGYLTMHVRPTGSPPDAPLHIKLTFGEMPVETAEPFSEYDGWISSSWLQEEYLHIDVLPGEIKLPRRYSFRYLRVDILDTSIKYNVTFQYIYVDTVTSADRESVRPLQHQDNLLEKMDIISIKTLEDCMQEVFEDGPKRDRRLWLGDLRLQALANYETFGSNQLVKRCLYLFAAVPDEKGRIAANLFIEPELIPDDTFLFDYSLFFTTTLYDYYQATEDKEALEDLWPLAYRQIELALERLDDRGIVIDDPSWWSFIDWNEQLNKQAPSQAILIYALRKAAKLAQILDDGQADFLSEKTVELLKATKLHLWDEETGFFVSGEEKQVSWATQVWMVFAGVLDQEANRRLLLQLLQKKPPVNMNTPYMYHHLVEALLLTGEKENAISVMKAYWGGMMEEGADTFWELYNPEDKDYSPYGSHLINSYCHAWSCTPTYLIRKYDI